ncbi:MAG: Histone deacetylase hda1 [Chaenotheca gracillima]|nr:MAG: Histone deacetylase hda1 [Chaenotheca gracillima]
MEDSDSMDVSLPSDLPEATREIGIFSTVSAPPERPDGEEFLPRALNVPNSTVPRLSTVDYSPRTDGVQKSEGQERFEKSISQRIKINDSSKEAVGIAKEAARRRKALPFAYLKTGVCYDVRMRFHATVADDDAHPEDPRRIKVIWDVLVKTGLVNNPKDEGPPKEELMLRVEARMAMPAEICLVHSLAHFNFIQATRNMDIEDHRQLTDDGDSVFFNAASYLAAMVAAGGTIETCKAVVAGLVKNAFAIVRPPGHHAIPTEAQGFCLFNNVSIAARVCQRDFPDKCKKILIFDWDVHHGNGTQDTFYEDPSVLYVSVHVHQNGRFYPRGPNGDHDRCGKGAGIGKNVNIPWIDRGMGDADYMLAFQKVVMPIATEFDPDFVIISAGFDAADGDELGGCYVTPGCYAAMTHALMSLAKGKLAVALEGGYALDSIKMSALAVVRTLMGEPPDRLTLERPSRLAEDDVLRVMRTQSKYWRCLQAADIDPIVNDKKGKRMHDVIRSYQSSELFRNHSMISLAIVFPKLSKSFKNQVLATPNYSSTKVILLVVHDPPEMTGLSDPRTNDVDVHNTWLDDAVQSYIQWAIEQGYGVIDINIPKRLSELDEVDPVLEGEDPPSVRAMHELMVYVWENYVQVSDADHVFVVGVGDAHYGVTHLLGAQACPVGAPNDVHRTPNETYPLIKGVVNFVSHGALRSIRGADNPYLIDWYHKTSLVFVSDTHPVWIAPKAPKRKFGRVVHSDERSLNSMLREHRETVTSWIRARADAAAGGARGAAFQNAAPVPSGTIKPGKESSTSGSGSLNVPKQDLTGRAVTKEEEAATAAAHGDQGASESLNDVNMIL